ncbi:P-loop containing nucleoside triphosphate hydrolase protein [Lindgomyces ingoldianus]|uniref:P-loop containing nucleoside triphosphate hydrolase protein n=1 Tax=Lindgomyces ingoldianus TaxID=673940 RepID=A0ACB6QMA3_9PLEO|nr:P-loop containing nucleoside triphosphate hydrolase protein [Lindgomyces ingoldianus]KAF2468030.1 P-loop containing nucleoside triphosphate hydrolase protein [Lindgomyces ingoldianus]
MAGVDTLEQLHSKEQESLLDAIDQLRSYGVSHHDISLPQVIVCGDQSTGKSSVLEGLTRLRFPTKDAQCTAFATELILRRTSGPTIAILCSIIPSNNRTQAQKQQLEKFQRSFSSREEFSFPSLLEEAKACMKIEATAGADRFSEDILRIRYTGPDLPSLTIVDLPGLIHFQVQRQSDEDAILVQTLVRKYMRNEKSIILAVVSARNDADNQVVLKYVRNEFDPLGTRTLGIITKPDTLDSGSETEQKFIEMAQNKVVKFELGWHVVKNRSFTEREQPDAERDESERRFFATGVWRSVSRSDVGIDALRTKLSKILLHQIRVELPSLVAAIENAIKATETRLQNLGSSRETSDQQRTYLTKKAEIFQTLTEHALRGVPSHPFFDGQEAKKLRTEIQNLNIAFAHIMYQKGHRWTVADDQQTQNPSSPFASSKVEEYDAEVDDPETIPRAEFLESYIGLAVQQNRQPGLLSLVNPFVVCVIFRQQSHRWRDIAKLHINRVVQAVREYVELSLMYQMDSRTYNMLFLEHIGPELEKKRAALEKKLDELLLPYEARDPTMYDPSFGAELDYIRARRSYESKTGAAEGGHSRAKQQLLMQSIDDFTNSEILDLMQTYYKRAITVFINNVAMLAIENCLVADLASIFIPSVVSAMNEEQLRTIGSESEEICTERNALKETLDALQSGKRVLDLQVCNAGIVLRHGLGPRKCLVGAGYPVRIQVSRPQTPASQMGYSGEDDDPIERMSSSFNSLKVSPPSGASKPRPSSASKTRSRTSSVTPAKNATTQPTVNEGFSRSEVDPAQESDTEDDVSTFWPLGKRLPPQAEATRA